MESNGKQYHIQLERGDVGKYVLLPGDPGRCEPISRLFDNPKHVATNREYVTYTGTLDGVPVSVTSTGIGCPSAAIALEELVRCGADTFIRVGTSGHIQKDIRSGELAIISAAIRDEGTSRHYMPIEFPAIADIDVVLALQAAAKKTGAVHRTGITQSKDSFYGQHEPERMGVAKDLLERWKAWEIGGALCSEMEASALFVIASMLRVRAGGVMMVHAKEPMPPLDILLETAVQGLRELIAADKAAGRSVTL
ncbi:MAG: nucleoside phosphorylase [Actinobacteria bacterium]|jgi:uridine phosphorylase|nr:nucleoside phosphorylase [Actinomycetota bacterium]